MIAYIERRGRNGPIGDWSTLLRYTHLLASKVALDKDLCPEKPEYSAKYSRLCFFTYSERKSFQFLLKSLI